MRKAKTIIAGSGKPEGAIVVLVMFLVAGSIILLNDVVSPRLRASNAKSWERVPCEIISSELKKNFVIKYKYVYNSKSYTSANFSVETPCAFDYETKFQFVKEHPVGHRATCYVNPANPKEAVINLDVIGFGWSDSFILLIAIIGFVGTINMAQNRFARKNGKPAFNERNIKRDNIFAWGASILFFGVGVTIILVAYLLPSYKLEEAANWDKTSCEIISSNFDLRENGIAYGLLITYRYTYKSQGCQSDNLSFGFDRSLSSEAMLAIKDKYPIGCKTMCYVNPDKPTEAVLHLEQVGDKRLLMLFASVFMIFGVSGIIFLVKDRKQNE